MSLADELLADLEDGDTEDIPNEIDEEAIPDEELMETEENHAMDVDVKVSAGESVVSYCGYCNRERHPLCFLQSETEIFTVAYSPINSWYW